MKLRGGHSPPTDEQHSTAREVQEQWEKIVHDKKKKPGERWLPGLLRCRCLGCPIVA
jgi:hypothetical protein